jgi:hypothetical protein
VLTRFVFALLALIAHLLFFIWKQILPLTGRYLRISSSLQKQACHPAKSLQHHDLTDNQIWLACPLLSYIIDATLTWVNSINMIYLISLIIMSNGERSVLISIASIFNTGLDIPASETNKRACNVTIASTCPWRRHNVQFFRLGCPPPNPYGH